MSTYDTLKVTMKESKPNTFSWYSLTELLFLPVVSVSANIIVCVVLFMTSTKLHQPGFYYYFQVQPPLLHAEQHNAMNVDHCSVFITSLLALCLIMTKHLEIANFYDKAKVINNTSLYFGCMFVFGKMMIETTSSSSRQQPSLVSICLYLLGASMYGTCQVYIFYRNFEKKSKYIQSLRAVFCVGTLVNVMIFGVFVKLPTSRMRTSTTTSNITSNNELDLEQKIALSVTANIFFQQLWSYLLEKFRRDSEGSCASLT